ncbi:MAG: hypothetical protein KGR26_14435, partial [Cyanobacteria bacterium REEB65]|nr:hypothetical protein [Cyanobacteria bacterium REEB65]
DAAFPDAVVSMDTGIHPDATLPDSGIGDAGSMPPACGDGFALWRGLCVPPVLVVYLSPLRDPVRIFPYALHYFPLRNLQGYDPMGARIFSVVRTSTTPSLYYAAFGLSETRIDGTASLVLPDRSPSAGDFCMVETVYGFSSCGENPFNTVTSIAIHNQTGVRYPPSYFSPPAQDAGIDAGVTQDASQIDSGNVDSGIIAAIDAGNFPDATAVDSGAMDAGMSDAGAMSMDARSSTAADAGTSDSGTRDATADAGADSGPRDSGTIQDTGAASDATTDAGSSADVGASDAGSCTTTAQCSGNNSYCWKGNCIVVPPGQCFPFDVATQNSGHPYVEYDALGGQIGAASSTGMMQGDPALPGACAVVIENVQTGETIECRTPLGTFPPNLHADPTKRVCPNQPQR